MKSSTLISIIVVNYRQWALCQQLLLSCQKSDWKALEIILVDSGSQEPAPAWLSSKFPEVQLIQTSQNPGYAAALNMGLKRATGDFFLLMNADTYFDPDLVRTLYQTFLGYADCGLVSPKIRYAAPPNRIQYAGFTPIHPLTGRNQKIGSGTLDSHEFDHTCPTAYIHGAGFMISKALYQKIGPLDEDYFLYYEELDYSERARRAGFSSYYNGNCSLFHHASISQIKEKPILQFYLNRNRIRFVKRYSKRWQYWIFLLYWWSIVFPITILRQSNAWKYMLKAGLRGKHPPVK